MTPTENPSSNPFGADEPPPSEAATARMNREAEIGEYMNAALARATDIAVDTVREEGIRWQSVLEAQHLTIQGVIENPTLGNALPLSAAVRALITRVEALERRLNAQNPDANEAEAPPANEAAAVLTANTKGILQERCIINECLAPVYTIVNRSGPPDAPVFVASCTIQERNLTVTGVGRNIRAAHQSAAHVMLRRLNWPVAFPTEEEREEFRDRRENSEQMEN